MTDDDLKRLAIKTARDWQGRSETGEWLRCGPDFDLDPEDTASVLAAGVRLLDAEVERLTKLVQVSPDDINAVVDENDRMQRAFSEAVAKLKAGGSVRVSSCEWCGESWPKLDGCTAEEVEANARRHVYACKKHPMKAERDAALAEVARLRLSPEECEALRWLRKNAPQVGGPGGHGMSDHVARLDALAALDRILAANGGE